MFVSHLLCYTTKQSLYKQVRKRLVQVQLYSINTVQYPSRRNIIHPKMKAKHRCSNKPHKFQVNPYNCNGSYTIFAHSKNRIGHPLTHLLCIFRQAHHQQQQPQQHSSHITSGHHSGSGSGQSGHIDAKYSDSVNGDTLTDFVTFVCQETDNSPQSSQV